MLKDVLRQQRNNMRRKLGYSGSKEEKQNGKYLVNMIDYYSPLVFLRICPAIENRNDSAV